MPAGDLTITSVPVNAPLTNLAIRYKVPDMVAERIWPVVPVQKESDVYYKFYKEELVDYPTLRAPGAEANEMAWDATTEAYKAEEYALRKLVPDRVARNADPPVRPAMTTVEKLKATLMIEQERRVAAIVQSATFVTNTSAIATAWDAASGQTPEKDVDTAKNAVRVAAGKVPNAILMNYLTAQALKRWLKATAYTTYSEYLDKNELPPVLWGCETIIGVAVRNTANAAKTETLSDIWTDNVTVFYKEASPSLDAMTFGYIMRAQNWITTDYYVDQRKGRMYEVSVVEAEELVSAACAYLLTNALT